MIIRRITLTVVALLAAVSLYATTDIASIFRWTIEMGQPEAYNLPSWHHGETVILEATYVNDGVPKDFTSAHSVEFWYRPASWPVGSRFSVVTGAVFNAEAGIIQARWYSSREFTNCSTYVYQFVVQSTTAQVMPGGGRFTLLGSLNDGGAGQTNPPVVSEIDWATTHNSNIGSAPFLSTFQIDDLQAQLDTLFNGVADSFLHSLRVTVPPTISATNMFDFPDTLARKGDIVPDTVTNLVVGSSDPVPSLERIDDHNYIIHFPIVSEGEITTTNRLYWVVGSPPVAVGYVSSNGITMLKGSLQLYEEDLNCNVRAYDGAKEAPSITFYSSPLSGWYRKSYAGAGAWCYAHNSNDVALISNYGWLLYGTRTYTGYGAELEYANVTGAYQVNGTNGRSTNINVIVSGGATQTLHFVGGILQ